MAVCDRNIIPDSVKDVFLYEPTTGIVSWKVARGTKTIGAEAGTVDKLGYIRIQYAKRMYLAHRIAWFLYYGTQPSGVLDHVDGNPSNNRIDNLRKATHSQNMQNASTRIGRSGVKNITWKRNAWTVRFILNGKRKEFGRFQDLDLAKEFASKVRIKIYGEFANHGMRCNHTAP